MLGLKIATEMMYSADAKSWIISYFGMRKLASEKLGKLSTMRPANVILYRILLLTSCSPWELNDFFCNVQKTSCNLFTRLSREYLAELVTSFLR